MYQRKRRASGAAQTATRWDERPHPAPATDGRAAAAATTASATAATTTTTTSSATAFKRARGASWRGGRGRISRPNDTGRGETSRLFSEYHVYPGTVPAQKLKVNVYMRHDPRQHRGVNSAFTNDMLHAALAKITSRQCVTFCDSKTTGCDATVINSTRAEIDAAVHETAGIEFAVRTINPAEEPLQKLLQFRTEIDAADLLVFDATPYCMGLPVVDNRLSNAAKRYTMQTRANLTDAHASFIASLPHVSTGGPNGRPGTRWDIASGGPVGQVYDAEHKIVRCIDLDIALEIGYALATKRRDQIVLLINTAYGTPDSLPASLAGAGLHVFTYTMMQMVHYHQYIRCTPQQNLPDQRKLDEEQVVLKRKTLNLLASELSYYVKHSISVGLRDNLLEQVLRILGRNATSFRAETSNDGGDGGECTCWIVDTGNVIDSNDYHNESSDWNLLQDLWNNQLTELFSVPPMKVLQELSFASLHLSATDRTQILGLACIPDGVRAALTSIQCTTVPQTQNPASKISRSAGNDDGCDEEAAVHLEFQDDEEEEEEEEDKGSDSGHISLLAKCLYRNVQFTGVGARLLAEKFAHPS